MWTYNSVSEVPGYELDNQGFILSWSRIFLITTSRPAMVPTHPPIKWVPQVCSWWLHSCSMKLTTNFHLMLRSGIDKSFLLCPLIVFILQCLGARKFFLWANLTNQLLVLSFQCIFITIHLCPKSYVNFLIPYPCSYFIITAFTSKVRCLQKNVSHMHQI